MSQRSKLVLVVLILAMLALWFLLSSRSQEVETTGSGADAGRFCVEVAGRERQRGGEPWFQDAGLPGAGWRLCSLCSCGWWTPARAEASRLPPAAAPCFTVPWVRIFHPPGE